MEVDLATVQHQCWCVVFYQSCSFCSMFTKHKIKTAKKAQKLSYTWSYPHTHTHMYIVHKMFIVDVVLFFSRSVYTIHAIGCYVNDEHFKKRCLVVLLQMVFTAAAAVVAIIFVTRSTLRTWGITFCNAWLILLVFLNKRREHQNQTTEATAVIKINTHIHVFLFPSSLFGFSSHGLNHTFYVCAYTFCRVYFCEKKK